MRRHQLLGLDGELAQRAPVAAGQEHVALLPDGVRPEMRTPGGAPSQEPFGQTLGLTEPTGD